MSLGRILAIVGLVLAVIFIVLGQLALLPAGGLFVLAFAALLL